MVVMLGGRIHIFWEGRIKGWEVEEKGRYMLGVDLGGGGQSEKVKTDKEYILDLHKKCKFCKIHRIRRQENPRGFVIREIQLILFLIFGDKD